MCHLQRVRGDGCTLGEAAAYAPSLRYHLAPVEGARMRWGVGEAMSPAKPSITLLTRRTGATLFVRSGGWPKVD